jgi:hypothetical protein
MSAIQAVQFVYRLLDEEIGMPRTQLWVLDALLELPS